MSKGGPAKVETHRQCALTRERRPVSELVRFVLDPKDRVVADLRCRLPGRGVWLLCAKDVVASAVAKNVFPRAFRQSVQVDEDLAEMVEQLLVKAALADLSLANKAGALVLGFAKIEVLGSKATVAGLVHASDASAEGGKKLAQRHSRGREDPSRTLPVVAGFKVEELSLALGRPNVVHAALIEGGASQKFLMSAARLETYRAGSTELAVEEDRGLGEV